MTVETITSSAFMTTYSYRVAEPSKAVILEVLLTKSGSTIRLSRH